jgi:ankyrin repeat protein
MLKAAQNNLQLIELLQNAGTNVNRGNINDKTALIMASRYNLVEVVDLLLKSGASVNLRNSAATR